MVAVGTNLSDARLDGHLSAMASDLGHLATWGIQAVEVPVHGLDAIQNGVLDEEKTRQATRLLEPLGLRISVHSPNSLDLMDQDAFELQVEVLRASLEFTQRIGAEIIVVHPGRWINEDAFLWQRCRPDEVACRTLQEREEQVIRELAQKYPDIRIGLENARPYKGVSPYCYSEKPAELVRQVERIDCPNVGITLDFGHLNLSARYFELDPMEEIRRMAPHVVHCHVHDNAGRSVYPTEKIQTHQLPLGKGDSHMPPGLGTIPFSDWMACLPGDYSGLMIAELRGRYFQQTQEAVDSVRRAWELAHPGK